MRAAALGVLILALFFQAPLNAGTYLGSFQFDPFIIVHPPGYDGITGGEISIDICASDPILVPALRFAIATWNSLTPTTGNCLGNCLLSEETDPQILPFHMEGVVTHELGHCGLGLNHINLADDTSFTASQDAMMITEGPDMIRGSQDDIVSPLPGTRVLHWFRIADNDPVAIDGTVIDETTYSRRILDFPAGTAWPASANRVVAESLGAPDTQSLMYSTIASGETYTGLVADDVDTVALGKIGNDFTANTTDDYTVELNYVTECAMADIEVRYEPDPDLQLLGECLADLISIQSGGLDIHQAIVPDVGEPRIIVRVNSNVRWNILFADGFESGNLTAWSTSN